MNREADVHRYRIGIEVSLSDLFARWPATIPIFNQYQMSCVGCLMAPFDTLQEAITNYQLNTAQFIAELEAAANAAASPGAPLVPHPNSL